MMWISNLPPFIPFFIAAILVLVTRGQVRNIILLATPVLGGLHLWLDVQPFVPMQASDTLVKATALSYPLTVFTYQLEFMRVDKLSLLFGYLFHIASFIAIVYALHVRDTTQQVAGLLYAGSALGAVFAGDLISLFIFWECLALSSVFLIWANRTDRAIQSGMRYLIFQVASGVLLLAGALVYYNEHASLAFDYIGLNGIGSWLIFLAFGIKCAFPFLHNWLTDAYPEATASGTVFLSAFSTKLAVYALARGYPGTELLIYIGAVMACFPIFYAVVENDLRRVLAYSMINQLGFMVVGVGIGTALALNGTVAHAFAHIIYKSLLFMSMGAVMYRVANIRGSDLGGLYKSMPWTATFCIIGAASISAFPLFSGFIAKSLIMVAVLKEGYEVVWLMLLFAAAGVFHHAGIKVPYFAFFHHDSGIRVKEAPINMLIAMGVAAFLCIFIGTQPQYLYALLPWKFDYWPYDLTHVLTQLQLLFFSALAFVWLNKKGLYPPELRSVNIDVEWTYRKLLPATARASYKLLDQLNRVVVATLRQSWEGAQSAFQASRLSQYHLASSWPTGSMVLWIGVILGGYLLADIYFK
ncbi:MULTISPECIES: Na(+)/H(+) antiporter subunit D [Cycloclasticus]|jgi:multicomponent Na+:H+ antiporter subunit D|uniref:Monovalent cation/H+ antiporter subunit D n=1 Tax=Cycloclasticus pugetii TaxID=34068 RepID=A0AB33Z4Y3_9GAMM|nr:MULTISPECIES: Na(+)/H(+) antiporter subunit D [Cycloclasticus]EPD14006.1 monovalent cation/H+ antiporter subunit D [Cycloclasticus pugetii]